MKLQRGISDKERELIFALSDGHNQILPIIYQLRTIWVQTDYNYPYLEALQWLVKHKIKGPLLREMFHVQFEDLPVNFASFLRQKALSEFKIRAVKAETKL